MIRPHPQSRPGSAAAFTLVEIAIAIGILAVSLVALMGMMPAGLSNFRKAMDISITAQIAQRLMHDMEQAEFNEVVDLVHLPPDPTGYCPPHYSFRAPKVDAPALRYFDGQGEEVIPKGPVPSDVERKAIVYLVNIRIIPRAELPTINEAASQVAQITVQVARTGGNRDIPILTGKDSDPNLPERNLFMKANGVTILTYPALLGKTQGK